MKKVKITVALSILAAFLFCSCDKDIDPPVVQKVYNGFFISGTATEFGSEIDSAHAMISQGSKASRVIKLQQGTLKVSFEKNSISGARNTISFGLDQDKKLVLNGGGPIEFNENSGDYLVAIDTLTKSLSFSPITSWGVFGDATTGGLTNDTKLGLLSYQNGVYTYSGELNLETGKTIQFRANNANDIVLGGSKGVLSIKGSKIKITASGNYKVTIVLGSKYTYSLEKVN